jgi:hypothetical protein
MEAVEIGTDMSGSLSAMDNAGYNSRSERVVVYHFILDI